MQRSKRKSMQAPINHQTSVFIGIYPRFHCLQSKHVRDRYTRSPVYIRRFIVTSYDLTCMAIATIFYPRKFDKYLLKMIPCAPSLDCRKSDIYHVMCQHPRVSDYIKAESERQHNASAEQSQLPISFSCHQMSLLIEANTVGSSRLKQDGEYGRIGTSSYIAVQTSAEHADQATLIPCCKQIRYCRRRWIQLYAVPVMFSTFVE